MSRAKPHNWTGEQRAFIENNIKGTPYNELREMFNSKYGLDMKSGQFNGFINRNGYKNGIGSHFVKGHKPWNKDKKGLNLGGEKGWFKKGQRPQSYRPVGSERVCTKDGYTKVKVSDEGEYSQMWKNKHVLVWEERNGDVPDGHAVCFLDGDVTNLSIGNLELISRGELARMNQGDLFSSDPELTRAGITLVRLRQHVIDYELNGGDVEKFNKAKGIAESRGVSEPTFIARLKRGWSLEDAANKPLFTRVKKRD